MQQSSRSSRHALRLTGSDRSLLEAQSSRASALQPERLGSARSALPLTSRCSRKISAPIPSGSDSSRLQLSCGWSGRVGSYEGQSELGKKPRGAERREISPLRQKRIEPKTTSQFDPSLDHHRASRSEPRMKWKHPGFPSGGCKSPFGSRPGISRKPRKPKRRLRIHTDLLDQLRGNDQKWLDRERLDPKP